MESLAAGGSIYVSAATADLVRGFFSLEDLGSFSVKGASEALRVHELQGTSAVHTQFDLAKTRGLSEFVGRTNEMNLLDTALEQSVRRSGPYGGRCRRGGHREEPPLP